jgi:hypothetical protein
MRCTFKHVLLKHKVFPPDVDDVVREGAAGGAIIVEARDAAVDVECGSVEHAPLRAVSMTPIVAIRNWHAFIRDSSDTLSKGLPLRVVISLDMVTSCFRWGTWYLWCAGVVAKLLVGYRGQGGVLKKGLRREEKQLARNALDSWRMHD